MTDTCRSDASKVSPTIHLKGLPQAFEAGINHRRASGGSAERGYIWKHLFLRITDLWILNVMNLFDPRQGLLTFHFNIQDHQFVVKPLWCNLLCTWPIVTQVLTFVGQLYGSCLAFSESAFGSGHLTFPPHLWSPGKRTVVVGTFNENVRSSVMWAT